MPTKLIGFFVVTVALCLLFCSCATQRPLRPALPRETDFNQNNLSDQRIYLMLRLNNRAELLFIADTGSGVTILDKSLEPLLGKSLGTGSLNYNVFGLATNSGIFAAPQLCLGGAPLLTAPVICTDDLSRFGFGRPVMGILGIDCLRHYCLQLDFAARKIRFLDPDHPEAAGGKFPISFAHNGDRPWIHGPILGPATTFTLDTGLSEDFALRPKLFDCTLGKLQTQNYDQYFYSREEESLAGARARKYLFPQAALISGTYTNFLLSDSRCGNLLGLRFLERHRVTLDFPRKTLCLEKRDETAFTADTRTVDSKFAVTSDIAVINEAVEFLRHLKETGQLPGWSRDDHERVTLDVAPAEGNSDTYPRARTFTITREHATSEYHCVVVWTSRDSPLHLQRAWETDVQGNVTKEWPVPGAAPASLRKTL